MKRGERDPLLIKEPREGWRCIDCWDRGERIAKLRDTVVSGLASPLLGDPQGTPRIGSFVMLCPAHFDERNSLIGTPSAQPDGRHYGWDLEREPRGSDASPLGFLVVVVGATNSQMRAERRRGGRSPLCPCHGEPHRKCPDAHPCIDQWCGRMTTAHEAPACGYCIKCSAGNHRVLMQWFEVEQFICPSLQSQAPELLS